MDFFILFWRPGGSGLGRDCDSVVCFVSRESRVVLVILGVVLVWFGLVQVWVGLVQVPGGIPAIVTAVVVICDGG